MQKQLLNINNVKVINIKLETIIKIELPCPANQFSHRLRTTLNENIFVVLHISSTTDIISTLPK